MALKVDLTGNSSGFAAMLNAAKAQTKAFANSVNREVGESWGGLGRSLAAGIAGAISFDGLKEALMNFAEMGKAIKEQAEQLDMSTDAWQRWNEAVNKAGLSTQGFQRIVETLHEKRTAAMTDPHARADLSRLGFSDADITGDMNMSDFTKRALANANGSDFQRKALGDVIGQRGLKYATALPNFDSAQAPLSEDDLKQAEEFSNVFRELTKVTGELTLGFVHFLEFLNPSKGSREAERTRGQILGGIGAASENVFGALIGKGWLWGKWRNIGQAAMEMGDVATKDFPQETRHAAGWHPPGTAAPANGPAHDPMDDMLAQQREELALHDQERQQALLDSQRGLMTIGDRRASIRGEMSHLAQEIAERNAGMAAGSEDFLTEAQKNELAGVTGKAREFQVNKLRSAFQDDTDKLQLRYNRDQADLKQAPLNFQADTLAKAGLYSASALNFNPVLGIMREHTGLLRQIANNTAPRGGISVPRRDGLGQVTHTAPAASPRRPPSAPTPAADNDDDTIVHHGPRTIGIGAAPT